MVNFVALNIKRPEIQINVSTMVVRFGLIVRIVKANFTYLGEKLLEDCGKYRIEHITNLFTLLIIVCLLTLL